MTKEYYENLGVICTSIINDPIQNIKHLKDLLKNKDDITLLALFKFLKILYHCIKSKLLKTKFIIKKNLINCKTMIKQLYHSYKSYINIMCNKESMTAYKIAAEILKHLDHFNFAEKIIEKIFKGHGKNEIKQICINAITEKLNNDTIGDSTFKILLNLLEFKYCDEIYKGISNINVINRLSNDYLEIKMKTKIRRQSLMLKI